MFDFERYPSEFVNWLKPENAIKLLGFVLVAALIILLLLPKRSAKAVKITKITIAVLLVILEIGRFVWYYLRAQAYNDRFDWWARINFHMCTMMVWLNATTLILSCFLKKENKLLNLFYHVIIGIGLWGALITFIYPEFADPFFEIWHFRNSQTITTHILLIVSPIYLLITKHFKIELKNIWVILGGLLMVGQISSLAGACDNFNFAYCFYCKFLRKIGILIPFPWHIVFILCVFFIVDFFIWFIIEVVRAKRQHKKLAIKITKFEVLAFIYTVIHVLMHPFLMKAILPKTPTLLGLLFLIPIFTYVFGIYTIHKITKKKN